MGWLLPLIAWIQTKMEDGACILHRIRRRLLLPLALHGGRDMVLLKNGQWVDTHSSIPPDRIESVYDAEKHTVRSLENGKGRLTRWSWLSVMNGSRDFSEFFADLRISAGYSLSPQAVLALLASQKAQVPVGPLRVTLRDGSEEILTEEGLPLPVPLPLPLSVPLPPSPSNAEVLHRVNSVNHIT